MSAASHRVCPSHSAASPTSVKRPRPGDFFCGGFDGKFSMINSCDLMDIGFHGITSGVQYKVIFMEDLMDIRLRMRRITNEYEWYRNWYISSNTANAGNAPKKEDIFYSWEICRKSSLAIFPSPCLIARGCCSSSNNDRGRPTENRCLMIHVQYM